MPADTSVVSLARRSTDAEPLRIRRRTGGGRAIGRILRHHALALQYFAAGSLTLSFDAAQTGAASGDWLTIDADLGVGSRWQRTRMPLLRLPGEGG